MLATFRMEMVKHVLRPRTYVVLGITIVVPLIIAFALKVNPPDFPSPEGGGGRPIWPARCDPARAPDG